MTITVKPIGIDLTDAQRAHIEKKAGKLDRFFGDEVECKIIIREDRNNKTVEMTLPLRGGAILRAQEATGEVYASMDAVMEKIMRQIRKHRTRLEKRTRDGAYAKAEMEAALTPDAQDEPGAIVRTKNVPVEPMTADEAISQMEMLGHTFFMFLDERTNSVCVVYERKDGNYGLLIPDA